MTSAGTIDKRLTGGFSSLQKRPQASTSRLRGMGGGWSLATPASGTGIGPVLLAGADGLDTVAGSGLDTGAAACAAGSTSDKPAASRPPDEADTQREKGRPTLATLAASLMLAFWRAASTLWCTYVMFARFCWCQDIFWKSGGVFMILAQFCAVFCCSWFGRL